MTQKFKETKNKLAAASPPAVSLIRFDGGACNEWVSRAEERPAFVASVLFFLGGRVVLGVVETRARRRLMTKWPCVKSVPLTIFMQVNLFYFGCCDFFLSFFFFLGCTYHIEMQQDSTLQAGKQASCESWGGKSYQGRCSRRKGEAGENEIRDRLRRRRGPALNGGNMRNPAIIRI